MKFNKGSVNPKILGLMLVGVSVMLVPTGFQNAIATNIITTDEAVEEAAEAGNATDIEFLGIQNAQSSSISEINATAYTLELNNVSDSTILFSERPNRIVTSISTSDFIGNWTTGPDSFAADAPNDALIVEDTQTGQLETAIIESFNPIYDTDTNTLTYTFSAENASSIEVLGEFGQSILIIDGFIY